MPYCLNMSDPNTVRDFNIVLDKLGGKSINIVTVPYKYGKVIDKYTSDKIPNNYFVKHGYDIRIDELNIPSINITIVEGLESEEIDNTTGKRYYEFVGGSYYPARNEIFINDLDDLNNKISDKEKVQILLHELIHTATYYKIRGNVKYQNELQEILDHIKHEYIRIFADPAGRSIAEMNIKLIHGLDNINELLSDSFSDKRFQNMLKSIPSIKNKSLWDDIVNFIRRILGLKVSNNVLSDILFLGKEILRDTNKIEVIPVPSNRYYDLLTPKQKESYYRAYYFWDKHEGNIPNILADIEGSDIKSYSVNWKSLKEKPLNFEKIYSIAKSIIPDITEDEVIVMNKMQMEDIFEKDAIGKFYNGLIYLLSGDNGTINEVILRHEIFHKLWSQYLTYEQRDRMVRLVKGTGWFQDYARGLNRTEDSFSMTEVEEFTAGLFQDYNITGQRLMSDNYFVQFIYDIFEYLRTIAIILARVFNRSSETQLFNLFDKINSGYYDKRLVPNEQLRISKSLKRVKARFPAATFRDSVMSYMNAREWIKKTVVEMLNLSQDRILIGNGYVEGVPVTLIEAVQLTISEMQDKVVRYFYLDHPVDKHNFNNKLWKVRQMVAQAIKDDEMRAVYYLYTTNKQGKYYILEDIVNELFEEFDKNELNYDVIEARNNYDEEQFDDETNYSGLADDIVDNMYVNPEDQSRIVKEFLALLPYTKTDTKTGEKKITGFVRPRQAFVLTTKLMERINYEAKNLISEIESLKKGANKEEVIILDKLVEVFKMSQQNESKGIKLSEKIYYDINNDQFVVDGHTQLRKTVGGERLDTAVYFYQMISKIKTLPIWDSLKKDLKTDLDIVYYLKTIAERDINKRLWASLVHRPGSLTEVSPVIASYEPISYTPFSFEGGSKVHSTKVKMTYMVPANIITAVKEQVASSLVDMYNNFEKYKKVSEIFEGVLYRKDPIGQLDKLMKILNLDYKSDEFNKSDIVSIVNTIGNIFFYFNPTFRENTMSLHERLLDEQNSNLKYLAGVLTKGNQFITAQNYIDSLGNKRYLHNTGSWIYDVMNGVVRGAKKILPVFLRSDNHISRNCVFNPRLKKFASDIYGFHTIEAYKQDKSTYEPIKPQNLRPIDVYNIKFVNGFLSVFARSKELPTFFISTQVQSNRGVFNIADIRVLSQRALIEEIEMAKKFEKERQELINKGDIRVKNFVGTASTYFLNKKNEDILHEIDTYSFRDFVEWIKAKDKWQILGNYDERYAKYVSAGLEIVRSKKHDILLSEHEKKLDAMFKAFTDKELLLSRYNNEDETNYNARLNVELGIVKDIWKLWNVWYRNNYVRGFHFDLLMFGDNQLAKNPEDYIKRMQGVQSPGKLLMINHGQIRGYTQPKHDYIVFNDITRNHNIVSDVLKIYSRLHNRDYKITDGVTFILPETLKEIKDGAGDQSLGGTLKNIVFYIDEQGITRYIKTASFVLSDELAEMFPEVRILRDDMRTNNVFHAIAISAFKTGSPLDILELGKNIEKKHIKQLDMRYYRIQLNPVHDDEVVSNFSQFTYHLNTNNLNREQTQEVYEIDSRLISLNWMKFNIKYKIIEKDGYVNYKNLKKALRDVIRDDDRLLEILDAHIIFDYPALQRKLIAQISGLINNHSVKIKHAGAKMTVQPALGIGLYQIGDELIDYTKLSAEDKTKADKFHELSYQLKEILIAANDIFTRSKTKLRDGTEITGKEYLEKFYKQLPGYEELGDLKQQYEDIVKTILEGTSEYIIPRRLRMDDGNGYSEVIVPEKFMDEYGLTKGDILTFDNPIYQALYKTGLAVRIPSTGLHSAVAIKIVASSDRTNNIIAPEELVILHGSDFDVDALFIIKREKARYDIQIGKWKLKKGGLVGYNYDGSWNNEFFEYLKEYKFNDTAEGSAALDLYIKMLKNKKVDLYLEIVTADRNKVDMTTPISFDPLKLDPFEDINKLSYDNYLISNNLKDDLGSFKQYYNDIVNSNGTNDIINVSLDDKQLKAFKEGLSNNRLVLPETIVEAIRTSNLGVVAKMKVITGQVELRQEKNLRTVRDQVQSHKDNFEGKSGVGLEATLMKDIAYMLFANGGEKVQLYNIKPDGTKEKKGYKYGDKIYDGFTLKTTNGQKTFELGDTLINGYIDNVNEQITWIINATKSTTRVIGYMIGFGFNLDSITYFMNQPVMREVGKGMRGYAIRYNEIISSLLSAYKQKGGVTNNETDFAKLDIGINDTNLIDIISKYYGQNLQDFIKTASKDEIASQIVVLRMYRDMYSDSSDLFKVSRVLNGLIRLPNKYEDIVQYLNDAKYLASNKFIFGDKPITEITHIRNAIEAVERQKLLLEGTFNTLGGAFQSVINKIIRDTGIHADGYMSWGYGDLATKEFIRKEFSYFIFSKFIEKMKQDGIIPVSKYKYVNKKTGEILSDEKAKDVPNKIEVGQVTIWKQEFIKRVIDYTNQNKKNVFLSFFSKFLNNDGLYELRFNAGTSVDPFLADELTKGYLNLPDDLRQDFLIYSVLHDKTEVAFRSYSKYIPARSKGVMESIDIISKYYEETLRQLMNNDGERLKILANDFEYQMILNNEQYIPRINDYGLNKEQKIIALKPFKIAESKIGDYLVLQNTVRQYIVSGDNVIYRLTDITATYNNEEHVVYEKIGLIPKYPEYNYDSKYETQLRVIDTSYPVSPEHYNKVKELLDKEGVYTYQSTVKSIYDIPEIIEEERVIQNTNTGDRLSVVYRRTVKQIEGDHGVKTVKHREGVGKTSKIVETEIPYKKFTITHIYSQANRLEQDIKESKVAQGRIVSKNELDRILRKISVKSGVRYTLDPNEFKNALKEAKGYEVKPEDYPAGFVYKGKVYINTTGQGSSYRLDTPIHEIAHIYIDLIKKNYPLLYNNLIDEVLKTKDGQRLVELIKTKYPEYESNDINEEVLVTYIGLEGAKRIKPNNVITKILNTIKRAVKSLMNWIGVKEKKDISDYTLNDIINRVIEGDIEPNDIGFKENRILKSLYEIAVYFGITESAFFQASSGINTSLLSQELRQNGFTDIVVKQTVSGSYYLSYRGKFMSIAKIRNHGLKLQKLSFEDDMVKTDNKSQIYTNINDLVKKTMRVTSFANWAFNPEINEKESLIDTVSMQKINTLWDEKTRDQFNTKRELRIYNEENILDPKNPKQISYKDFVLREEKKYENKQLEGRVFHKGLEAKIKNDESLREEYKEMTKSWSELDRTRMTELIDGYYDNKLKSLIGQSKVYSEVTVTLPGINFKFMDSNGVEQTVQGISGTLDLVIDKGGHVYSIIDHKLGYLSETTSNEMLKFAKRKGIAIGFSYTNLAKLEVILRMLAIKYHDNDATFDYVSLLKPYDKGESFHEIPIITEKGSDFAEYVNLLEEYFKENHNEWYKNNTSLFNARSYISYSKELGDTLSTKKEKGLSYYQARENEFNRCMIRLQELEDTKIDGKLKKQEDINEYHQILGTISELTMNVNIFKEGVKKTLRLPETLLMGMQEWDTPITEVIYRLFSEAQAGYIANVTRVSDKMDKEVMKVVKRKGVIHLGANYKDMYKFFWKERDEVYGTPGYWMRTYLDNDWDTLTPEQQHYMDYFRWEMRFQLFLTMNPQQGVHYIETEMKQRKLSDEDRQLLESQIKELKQQPDYNKFPLVNKAQFDYFEGWVPRAERQIEEASNTLEFLKDLWKSSFILSNDEYQYLMKGKDGDGIIGLPLRYFGKGNESGELQRQGEYTFNAELIFRLFTMNVIRKRYMDNVSNYAKAVVNWMEDTKKEKDPDTRNTINAIKGIIHSTIDKTRVDIVGSAMKIVNPKGDVKLWVNPEKFLQGSRNLFAISALALKILSPLRTGIAQSDAMWIKAMAGSLSYALFPRHRKDIPFGMKEVGIATSNYLRSTVKRNYEQFKDDPKITKLDFFDKLIGNRPGTYDYKYFNKNKLKTGMGYLANKQLNNDALFFMYKIWDNYGYSVVMESMLRRMIVKKNGKDISMWDAYEKEGDTFTYKGDIRGTDKNTGKLITGLTAFDIIKIKKFSRDLFGGMREDEKAPIEANIAGQIFMQFKHYYPAMMNNAWKGKFENINLGEYFKTDEWEVIDEKSDEYGKRIKMKEGDEVWKQYESKGIVITPVLEWTKNIDEGYIRTLLNTGLMMRYIVVNPARFTEYWKNLSGYQRQNIVLAVLKLTQWIAFGFTIAAIFGSGSEEDDNVWIKNAYILQQDLSFEYFFLNYDNIRTNRRTITAVPTIEKLIQLVEATYKFGGGLLTGERIKTGKYKGWVKGTTSFLRSTPVLSTGWDWYNTFQDWGEMDEEMRESITEKVRM